MDYWGTKLRQMTLKTIQLTVQLNTFSYVKVNVASNREKRELSTAA